jgi:hypothetical protein
MGQIFIKAHINIKVNWHQSYLVVVCLTSFYDAGNIVKAMHTKSGSARDRLPIACFPSDHLVTGGAPLGPDWAMARPPFLPIFF